MLISGDVSLFVELVDRIHVILCHTLLLHVVFEFQV